MDSQVLDTQQGVFFLSRIINENLQENKVHSKVQFSNGWLNFTVHGLIFSLGLEVHAFYLHP